MSPSLFLALAFVRNGRRTWLLPGLLAALSVAGAIVISAVARGFDAEIVTKLLNAGGHVRLTAREGKGFPDYREAVALLAERGTHAAPRFEGEAVLETGEFSAGVRVVGIVPTAEVGLSPHLVPAPFAAAARPLVVGAALARSAHLAVGDRVQLRGTLDPVDFTVTGTFAIGLRDYDTSFVYAPLPEVAALFDYPDLATALVVRLADPDAAPAAALALERDFPLVRAEPWQSANRSLVATIAVEKLALRVIVALVALLSLAGVAFLLVVAVDERRRTIGTLEAFGMGRAAIRRAFLYEGLLVAGGGVVAGLLLGQLGAALVGALAIPLPPEVAETYASARLPVVLDPADALFIAGIYALFSLAVVYGATARLAHFNVRELMQAR